MELRPQIFFWRNLCDFVVQKKNLGVRPPRPPLFPATENSEICDFWPKIAIFELLRGYNSPKHGPRPQNFFGNTFGCFWCGPIFFAPPRPQNPHFRPQKFLHMAIFRRKSPFLGYFRLKLPHQGSKIQKKTFSQKVSLSPWIFEKTPKNDPEQVVAPVECHYRFFSKFPKFGRISKILKIQKIEKFQFLICGFGGALGAV